MTLHSIHPMTRRLTVLAAAFALNLTGCPNAVNVTIGNVERFHSAPQRESFPLRIGGEILLRNEVGTIEVIGTAASNVTVTATRHIDVTSNPALSLDGAAYLDQVVVSMTGNGREITLIGDTPPRDGEIRRASVDFLVEAPYDAVIDIQNGVGATTLKNVEGPTTLAVDTGNVSIRRDTLPLEGEDLSVSVDVGNVTMTLPGSSSFSLMAEVAVGAINIAPAFEIVPITRDGIGASALGTAGTGDTLMDVAINVGNFSLSSNWLTAP